MVEQRYTVTLLNADFMPPDRDQFTVMHDVDFAALGQWVIDLMATGVASSVRIDRSSGPAEVSARDSMWIRAIAGEVTWRKANSAVQI